LTLRRILLFASAAAAAGSGVQLLPRGASIVRSSSRAARQIFTIRMPENPIERICPMLTITAIIRTKAGHDRTMRDALLAVAENVRANEPETIDFFVSQDSNDPCVFTTYERFIDQAAMDRHNNSDVVARFFGIAKPILDGDVILVTSSELFAKG
jgi:quinol monooxygenase YgiN